MQEITLYQTHSKTTYSQNKHGYGYEDGLTINVDDKTFTYKEISDNVDFIICYSVSGTFVYSETDPNIIILTETDSSSYLGGARAIEKVDRQISLPCNKFKITLIKQVDYIEDYSEDEE